MFTKIKTIEGFINFYKTQQFTSGVYIIVNNNPASQWLEKDILERDWHIKIRRKCLKNNGIILDGTKIENYRGRYKINKFQK